MWDLSNVDQGDDTQAMALVVSAEGSHFVGF